MTQRRIWDVSQRIHAAMPQWPGEPAINLTRHAQIDADCPVNVGAISMPLHTGTHGDAPLHYDPQGGASDTLWLDPYLGRCVVIDVSHADKRVEVEDCDWAAIEGHSRVLLRTYEQFPHAHWDSDFTAIAPEVIERMAQAGGLLIGVNTCLLYTSPSPRDRQKSRMPSSA